MSSLLKRGVISIALGAFTNSTESLHPFPAWFVSYVCIYSYMLDRCRVEPFTEEEAKSHGQSFGLKLVPYIETKRVWYMYADNEQDMLEWQAVS